MSLSCKLVLIIVLMCLWNRYSTFAFLAGADPLSDKATAPTPLESVNLWPSVAVSVPVLLLLQFNLGPVPC